MNIYLQSLNKEGTAHILSNSKGNFPEKDILLETNINIYKEYIKKYQEHFHSNNTSYYRVRYLLVLKNGALIHYTSIDRVTAFEPNDEIIFSSDVFTTINKIISLQHIYPLTQKTELLINSYLSQLERG